MDAQAAPLPHLSDHSPGLRASRTVLPQDCHATRCQWLHCRLFATDCRPPCSWLAIQGLLWPLAAQLAGGHLILLQDSISSQDFLADSSSSYSLLSHQSPALLMALLSPLGESTIVLSTAVSSHLLASLQACPSQLRSLLASYPTVFSSEISSSHLTHGVQHHIPSTGPPAFARTICIRPSLTLPSLRRLVSFTLGFSSPSGSQARQLLAALQ